MIKERICHTYLKYTGREIGEGSPYEEEIGGGKTEVIEICGIPLEEWGSTGVFYCPSCDRLGSMLPAESTEPPPS